MNPLRITTGTSAFFTKVICVVNLTLVLASTLVTPVLAADLKSSEAAAVAAIRTELARSVSAWNAGDVRAFMTSYWQDERLRFASGGSVTRGWQATLDRYLERYGNNARSMGRLSFSGLEIDPLGGDAAVVFGRYHLDRDGETSEGLFTLIWRRIDGAWRIVADHTSSAD